MDSEAEKQRPKYRDKFQLLNKAEQDLYWRLTEAMPALVVLTQVSMSQVFHLNRRDGYLQLGEVGRKSIDFLLCRKDFSIVTAIELNGPTHEREKQKKADETKRRTLEDAGIPLVIFYPDKLPEIQEIRRTVAPYIVERRQYEAERNERYGFKKQEGEHQNTRTVSST